MKKALYGLKQALRVWYKTLTDFLTTLGFQAVLADSRLYIKDGIFIAIYVDDLLLIGKDKLKILKLKDALH